MYVLYSSVFVDEGGACRVSGGVVSCVSPSVMVVVDGDGSDDDDADDGFVVVAPAVGLTFPPLRCGFGVFSSSPNTSAYGHG